jgi:hypothetical protein
MNSCILTAKDKEDVAIQTCDPFAWRIAAQAYFYECNYVKWAECLRQWINAIIYCSEIDE